jgi:hypothetical protein
MTEHMKPEFKFLQHTPDYIVIVVIIHVHLMMVGWFCNELFKNSGKLQQKPTISPILFQLPLTFSFPTLFLLSPSLSTQCFIS